MSAQPLQIVKGQNGVLQVLDNKKTYYVVEDVMKMIGVSQPKAYKIIRALREELIADGKLLSEYPVGRIPKKYFDLRCGNE